MRRLPLSLLGLLGLFLASPALAQPSAPPAGLLVAPVGTSTSGNVSAYFQPFGDSEGAALAELARAQKTVHLAHYNIRNTRFHDALLALKNRGVEVKIETDLKEANQPWNWLTGQFVSEGFDLLTFQPPTSKFAIMHLKTCVIDGQTVMTGSYNWNNTAQMSNDENMIVVRDPQVAAEYERFMDAIRANQSTKWKPQIAKGSPIEVHFAPSDKPGYKIEDLIDGAKDRVTVAMFTLTDKWIGQKLQAAAQRGVKVEIVTEAKQAAISPIITSLVTAGCRVIIGANQASTFSAMHHKYAVVDDTVVTGACNWTKTGLLDSCEDVIIIRDVALARTYRHNWKALVKRYDSFNYDPFQYLIATPTAHLQFVVKQDRTSWGDRVVVVGNLPELGSWDPAKGIDLRTADDIYPRWSASVTLPSGAAVEYKYVTIDSAGNATWEDGYNRTFTVDPEGTDEARVDDYRQP